MSVSDILSDLQRARAQRVSDALSEVFGKEAVVASKSESNEYTDEQRASDVHRLTESLTGEAAFDRYVQLVSASEGYPGSEYAAAKAHWKVHAKFASEYPKLTAAAREFDQGFFDDIVGPLHPDFVDDEDEDEDDDEEDD